MRDAKTPIASDACHDTQLGLLAHELHDGACQELIAAYYCLDASRLLRGQKPGEAAEAFSDGMRLLERGIRQLRDFVNELRFARRANDELLGALQKLVRENVSYHGLSVTFEHNLDHRTLPPEAGAAAYRIAQEGLANVRRHSRSTEAVLEIVVNDRHLRVVVEDRGVGFDPDRKPTGGFGLEGVLARTAALGGRATVTSTPGKGTRLAAEIPLP